MKVRTTLQKPEKNGILEKRKQFLFLILDINHLIQFANSVTDLHSHFSMQSYAVIRFELSLGWVQG